MVYFTGVSGRLQLWDGANYSSIGAVSEFTAGYRSIRTEGEDTIGTRKTYVGRTTEKVPTWSLRYALGDFSVLTNFLFVTGEGALTKFHWRYFDGTDYGEIYNCVPDSIELTSTWGREISVVANGIAENTSHGLPSLSWNAECTTPAMTYKNTVVLNISTKDGNTDLLSHFREYSFRVNNNAIYDVTGNVITPADTFAGKAKYTGRIEIAKSITSFGKNINQSNIDIQYALLNREASPVRKTFTFKQVSIREAEVHMPMDLVLHRIEWQGTQLNISTGT